MKQTYYPDSKTLLELYDEDLKRLGKRIGKDRSAHTMSSMRQGRKYVAAFLVDQLKCQDIPADELESSLIEDFSTYLSAERGLRGGTVWLSCLQLKGVVRRAYQRGDLSKDPFNGFHIHKKIRPREYLTEEELIQLMNHPFQKKNLCLARDIFIFSALTGLSFIDIQELRPTDVRDIDGAAWIISSRHKTRIPFEVKLLDKPLQILQHYQKEGNEKVFGHLNYRAIASYIRQVMDEMGFNKHITMHCGRHTFATLALSKGVPIESVSRVLGHTNIVTTQIYARITSQKLNADLTMLGDKLNASFKDVKKT